jgi:hypothetical protein
MEGWKGGWRVGFRVIVGDRLRIILSVGGIG